MDISLKEVNEFKRKLANVKTSDNELFIKLFLVLIEHLENINQVDYFSYLLHDPLNDFPEEDDKKLYKDLVNNNSNQVIDLTSILPDIKSNNYLSINKKMKNVFQNAIFTSDEQSPLSNDHSPWFNKSSKDLFRKVKKMNSLYKESLENASNIDYIKKFSSELNTTSQKGRKRNIKSNDTKTKVRKITNNDIQEKILDVISDIDWNDFLKDIITLSQTELKNYMKEFILSEINKKLEFTNIEKINTEYKSKIEDLNKNTISVNELLVKNQILNTNLENIRKELNELRQKTRTGINTSEKNFSQNYINKMEEIQNKSELFDKIYSEKLNTMQNMFSEETLKRNYSALFNKGFKNIADIKISYDNHFKKQVDDYKLQMNSLQEQIDLLKDELSNKKSHIDKVFKEYEKIKDDIKKRVNSMTGFVGDFFSKMSAAANGLAITIDD